MKSVQAGSQFSRKENPSGVKNLQLLPHNGFSSSPKLLASPAGYTLPGVISYLASEFTNLERYKIVNNIEKSEMKFKIQQLVSEVNSLKYTNNKQALRIKELESRLLVNGVKPIQLDESGISGHPGDSGISGDSADTELSTVSGSSNVPSSDVPTSRVSGSGTLNQRNGHITSPKLEFIPPVDLNILRDSRLRLNSAIREALEFLKPPTTTELLDDCNLNGQSDFENLIQISEEPMQYIPAKDKLQKESVFSLYTVSSDDMLSRQTDHADKNVKAESHSSDVLSTVPEKQRVPDASGTLADEISDTETVIVDEPDVARLLISDDNVIYQDDRILPPPNDALQ